MALGDNLPAMNARTWADIDQIICRADGILIMLHHDDRISQIAQAGQGLQQAIIIALVQADDGSSKT